MYTVDDNNNNYEDDYVEYNSLNNKTGLIIKIIIIVICLLVLIWLIKSLKNNNYKSDNGQVHNDNVLLLRISAEEYYFIKDNKDKVNSVSLQTLKNEGFTRNIVDANGKECNYSNTRVRLDKESSQYKMTISLACSTNDKEEVFYYQDKTLACKNCNGKTLMNGNTIIAKADTKEDNTKEVNTKEDNTNNSSQETNNTTNDYSCIYWTNWSKDRVFDSSLEERTKTLVLGVKYGETVSKVEYGEWSEYTTTPIIASDNLEVETKEEYSSVWSSPKKSSNIDTNNKNIRILSTEEINNYTNNTNNVNCPNGYVEKNNKCYSNIEKIGNLTYKEFNSGNYKVNNGLCEGVKTIKYNDGKYYLTYVNCRYNEIANNINVVNNNNYSNKELIYTYQELVTKSTTYYRSRTVTIVNTTLDNTYTSEKYEENALPAGYVKLDGSEEIYYSYKLAVCEK